MDESSPTQCCLPPPRIESRSELSPIVKRSDPETSQTGAHGTRWLTLVCVTVAIGVVAGLGGMAY